MRKQLESACLTRQIPERETILVRVCSRMRCHVLGVPVRAKLKLSSSDPPMLHLESEYDWIEGSLFDPKSSIREKLVTQQRVTRHSISC